MSEAATSAVAPGRPLAAGGAPVGGGTVGHL